VIDCAYVAGARCSSWTDPWTRPQRLSIVYVGTAPSCDFAWDGSSITPCPLQSAGREPGPHFTQGHSNLSGANAPLPEAVVWWPHLDIVPTTFLRP